ncbi:class I SAM-dependent methyltransferase [endosymbiont of Ridgeia piscesae]|jgi:SAM-dependent methyltransferase|nr:class I SAM-dependent methyltransferase [endosymbiont of Ridgeia piscesae]
MEAGAMGDRKQHWEQVYRDKSPLEVSWYQKEPSLSLELIRNSGIQKDDPIIDVGGGASLLVDRLQQTGYSQLSVLDISARSLAYAQSRLGEAARQIEWHEVDVTEFSAPHRYALWHDRAVFHFLTKAADREKYAEVLNASLRPNGHLVIAAFAIGGPTQCSGLDIVQYDAERLLNVLGDGFQLLEELSESHPTPAGKRQAFSYFHLHRL